MRAVSAVLAAFLLVAPAHYLAAQDAPGSATTAEFWLSMPKAERERFIFGFGLGVAQGTRAAAAFLHDHEGGCHGVGPKLTSAVVASVDTRFSASDLEPAVTELYRDPANARIGLVDAILIARDRLRGNDVNPAIGAARKSGADLREPMLPDRP